MPDGSSSASPAARVALRVENIPQSLKSLNQWCVWKYEARATGKPAKKPYQPSGIPAKSNDAATWVSFDDCLKAYQSGKFAGIGVFVVGNLSGVDLDGCRDADGATPDAAEILGKFAGTYSEISPSGAGYRILCLGKPQRSGKNTGKVKWVEVYAEPSSRFLTITGHSIGAADVTAQQSALDWLHDRHFAAKPDNATTGEPSPPPPVFTSPNESEKNLFVTDIELLGKASRDAGFAALWAGDTSGYGGDASSADMALCGRLAWWTNGDAAAIDRLFRLSGLYRDKWDGRRGTSTYGADTVAKAIANCRGGYAGQRPDGAPEATSGANAAGKGVHSGGGGDSDNGAAGAFDAVLLANCGIEPEPGNATPPRNNKGGGWITGAALLRTQFKKPVWLLPDLIPDTGCYLLSGKPKLGKSWFALGLALAVAQGGKFLDRDVPRGRVLYLALEDTPRRLKSRLLVLQPDCEQTPACLDTLALRTDAPQLGAGLEVVVEAALSAGDITLVVVDTLQKVRGGGTTNGNQYGLDYAAVSALKQLADNHNCVFLVLHHLRKAEADDIHDCVSGTLGITGAADGSLVLTRQRGDGAATLHATGRDMDESEHGLRFERGVWTYAGSAVEVRASNEQNEVFEALKPYGANGATANEVCRDIGKKGRVVRHHIGKLVDAGRVRVRHEKPPRYAICDGPGDGTASVTTPPEKKREREKKSENLIASVASVARVTSVASVASSTAGNGGNAEQRQKATAGNAGNGGNLDVASGFSQSTSGESGSTGNAGNGGNANGENWFEV